MELQKDLLLSSAISHLFSPERTFSPANLSNRPVILNALNAALKKVVSDAALLQEIFSIRPSLDKLNEMKRMLPFSDQVTRLRKKLKLLQEKRTKTKARPLSGGAASISNQAKPVQTR